MKGVQLNSGEFAEDEGFPEGQEGFKYSASSTERLRRKLLRLVRGLALSDVWLHGQRHKVSLIRQLQLDVGLIQR